MVREIPRNVRGMRGVEHKVRELYTEVEWEDIGRFWGGIGSLVETRPAG